MPVKSEAQRRFMYAVAEGKVAGVKPSVGREFIGASHGLTHLPAHARKMRRAVGRKLAGKD